MFSYVLCIKDGAVLAQLGEQLARPHPMWLRGGGHAGVDIGLTEENKICRIVGVFENTGAGLASSVAGRRGTGH